MVYAAPRLASDNDLMLWSVQPAIEAISVRRSRTQHYARHGSWTKSLDKVFHIGQQLCCSKTRSLAGVV